MSNAFCSISFKPNDVVIKKGIIAPVRLFKAVATYPNEVIREELDINISVAVLGGIDEPEGNVIKLFLFDTHNSDH